jgi:hypothetical protein
MGGDALRICHTHQLSSCCICAWKCLRERGRRGVSYMSHTVAHKAGGRAGGALHICHTRRSQGRRCVTYMSHPSHLWQAARCVYVTRGRSQGRWCVTFMSHPSLTGQVVRYVYGTPVSPSLTGEERCYVYVTPVTHITDGALRMCHTRHSHGRRGIGKRRSFVLVNGFSGRSPALMSNTSITAAV